MFNHLPKIILTVFLALSLVALQSFAVTNTASESVKTVQYLFVPAITGNRADSHFEFIFSPGIEEITVNLKTIPKGARVLAVTAPSNKPVNVLVKITNAANREFSATCLLSLSTQHWARATPQPADADCGNFPLSGTVDPQATRTVIGISTPNTKPTPLKPKEEFRVPLITINVVRKNLNANWAVVHDFKDADVSYKVTLYNTVKNHPVHEQVMTGTALNFNALPDGKYKVRIMAQDTKGRVANPVYTDSPEVTIPPSLTPSANGGYYVVIPNYHGGKPDNLQVTGVELTNPQTPLPPGAVLLSINKNQRKEVRITITNTSPKDANKPAPIATCLLAMTAKEWSITENEKAQPGCSYFPQKGGIAGTLEVPAVIQVATPN